MSCRASVDAPATLALEADDVLPPHGKVVDPAGIDMRANVGRDLRDQARLWRSAVDHAIDQSVSAEIFDASDAERKVDVVAIRLNILRQERLRPESYPGLAFLDQVHRRRSDESGGEEFRRRAVDLMRSADLVD